MSVSNIELFSGKINKTIIPSINVIDPSKIDFKEEVNIYKFFNDFRRKKYINSVYLLLFYKILKV